MQNHRCMRCMELFDTDMFVACPNCGRPLIQKKEKNYYLSPGFVLEGRYIIGDALGSGGFGITYIAWDQVLGTKVAIKEFLPSGYSSRSENNVTVKSFASTSSFQFESGLSSFIDEAHRIAECGDLPGVVRVLDTFIANSTGYIVMEYLDGITMSAEFKQNGGPLYYIDVINWALPILDSLQLIHQKGIVHRDIAPDNIIKTTDGRYKLIDFGAARYSSVKSDQQLSVVLKQGYSPIEQYDSSYTPQAHTDIYALAASMYHMITGTIPISSYDRISNDQLFAPNALCPNIPQRLNDAIMKALSVQPDARYQTALEFADELRIILDEYNQTQEAEKKKQGRWTNKMKIAVAALSALSAILIAIIIIFTLKGQSSTTAVKEDAKFPIVNGLTLDEANEKLAGNDIEFVADKDYEPTKDTEMAGTIVGESQEVKSGTIEDALKNNELEEKDGKKQVHVKLYKLQIEMPSKKDLEDKSKDEVEKKLKNLGFKNIEFKKAKNDKGNKSENKVKSVSSAGKTIYYDDEITIEYYGEYKPATTSQYKSYSKKKSSKAYTTTKKNKPATTKSQKSATTRKSSGGSSSGSSNGSNQPKVTQPLGDSYGYY